ncbi:hypothetical protein NKH55_02010 [Mesorhizobium opportunistum]|uniref:hypothetical protein n=1 Tax=Mesorhizobium opportunistum TaxID=593909 RepID=UPI00333AAC83
MWKPTRSLGLALPCPLFSRVRPRRTSEPSFTLNIPVALNIYADQLPVQQEGTAAVVDAALNAALQE